MWTWTQMLTKCTITFPAGIYLLKLSSRNTRKKVWNMFKVNYELWTYFTSCSGVSNANFEQVNADWVAYQLDHENKLGEKKETGLFGEVTLMIVAAACLNCESSEKHVKLKNL